MYFSLGILYSNKKSSLCAMVPFDVIKLDGFEWPQSQLYHTNDAFF